MAQSDLIIIVFEHRQDAPLARIALEMMREQHLLGLEHATEITCDGNGRTLLHQRLELPAYPHPPHSRLPSLLSAAIFGHATAERRQRLADAGIDEFFLRRVTQALVPDSSALLFFVPHDSLQIDRRALLGAIALLKGTMHRTSVPPGIEQTLLNHLQLF